MNDEKTLEMLMGIIDDAFNSHYKKEEKMETQPETTNDSARDHFPNLYESIEDYTAQTGKRFRMTKNQKERGLSRDEAFSEMYLGGTN
jgi:hypothetical protein